MIIKWHGDEKSFWKFWGIVYGVATLILLIVYALVKIGVIN